MGGQAPAVHVDRMGRRSGLGSGKWMTAVDDVRQQRAVMSHRTGQGCILWADSTA